MFEETDEQPAGSSTSPPEGHPSEATTPPGNPERDEEAIRESEEKLEQAGGGH